MTAEQLLLDFLHVGQDVAKATQIIFLHKSLSDTFPNKIENLFLYSYLLRPVDVEEDVGVVAVLPSSEVELQSVLVVLEDPPVVSVIDIFIDFEFVVSPH